MTHWPLSEIVELDEDDFTDWYNTAIHIETQINKG